MVVGIFLYDSQSLKNRDSLLSTPEEVIFEEIRYHLETSLWRDFMPISPPDGQPLIALIKVISIENVLIPSTLDVDRLWIINGYEVWESTFSEELDSSDGCKIEKIARNGPKWDTGIRVDVVVRLIGINQKSILLRASNQIIGRTA